MWAQTPAGKGSATNYLQVVNPADPGLTWAPVAEIPLGTALGSGQLSATAKTPGSFIYDPPAGTVLLPGLHTLSVTFQPDNPNFATATATVPLLVKEPNGSTFTLALAAPAQDEWVLATHPDRPLKVQLAITPVGNFLQPVKLNCTPPQSMSCVITPSTVRPEGGRILATLTIRVKKQLASGQRNLGSSQIPRPAGFVFLSAFLLAGLRRRLSARLRRMALAAAILATLPSLTAIVGCGTTRRGELIQVTATSLVESKSLDLFIDLRDR